MGRFSAKNPGRRVISVEINMVTYEMNPLRSSEPTPGPVTVE
jgi:hypothetical protein